MRQKELLSVLPRARSLPSARAVRVLGCTLAIVMLYIGGTQPAPAPRSSHLFKADVDEPAEPITPIVEFVAVDPSKVKLGERLFSDPRLSRDNTRSCSSCHDISTNGASKNRHDTGLDGTSLQLNTSTVFNASLSFRVGWEGKFRTLESHAVASLKSPQTLGASIPDIVARLDADADLRREFVAAYDHEPDAENVLDALSNFERSLVTPGSRFDRWLAGDAAAMSAEELAGYRSFKKLGCISCHQGENIGGNLFERHGLFHPLASPKPEILRVPSLRNVATTPPYFHDGSAPTLDDAVRKMAFAQLNFTLPDEQVADIVAFLQTLTGTYRGKLVGDQR